MRRAAGCRRRRRTSRRPRPAPNGAPRRVSTCCWPITGATFILMHKKQTNAATAHDVLAFFDWAYKNGNPQAIALDYVPLPDVVKAQIRKSWATILGPDGKPVYH